MQNQQPIQQQLQHMQQALQQLQLQQQVPHQQQQQQQLQQQQLDWHQTLPMEERRVVINRMSEALKALSPTVPDQKLRELAATFENVILQRSPTKTEYLDAYSSKLQQIRTQILELPQQAAQVPMAPTPTLIQQQQLDWRQTLPTEERLVLIKRLSDTLMELSPTIPEQKILELAKTFENVILQRSPTKIEYLDAYSRKLQQIRTQISEQPRQAAGRSPIVGPPQSQVPMASTPPLIQ
ncbi:hypothetical protein BGZ68_010117 [Mortierella alpina]|nr:hypothetical protein BGZ68_010117 [Mortierella alpina]